MPFEIVRNDIVNMCTDAIVNTANPKPVIGFGIDSAIHHKAGPELLSARKAVGHIAPGSAAATPAFALNAKYVIHTVGPVWRDGANDEESLLRMCYKNSLITAKTLNCESIAFPLISAGNHGFPKHIALRAAISEISAFLMENDMQVYLVVFGRDEFRLSEKLFDSVASYIDDTYTLEKTFSEYGIRKEYDARRLQTQQQKRAIAARHDEGMLQADCIPMPVLPSAAPDWNELLTGIDAGFSETLLKLIDKSGKKDSEIYRRANVDRKLFSKIRNNPDYKPSKPTALSFAIALELDIETTRDFISRAGYALTHSSKFDIIVEYFIVTGNYNIHELNAVLFENDLPLLCT